jgi:hypothetical protein
MENFVIDSLAWYQNIKLNQDIKQRFVAIASFLQANGLAKRQLIGSDAAIPEDFSLNAEDLTEEGMEFIKLCYSKWVKSIDKGKPATDTRMLEKELKKLRGSRQ